MSQAILQIRSRGRPLVHNLKLLLPAVLLLVVLTGAQAWRLYLAEQPELQANGVPISREIEERFGVRFTGLYVVAAGGMIDLRYRVVDAGKARNFGHFTETSPTLIAEDSGRLVDVTVMMLHNHRVEAGRLYYVLYRNTAAAIQPGRPVTVQIGDLTLKRVIAQ